MTSSCQWWTQSSCDRLSEQGSYNQYARGLAKVSTSEKGCRILAISSDSAMRNLSITGPCASWPKYMLDLKMSSACQYYKLRTRIPIICFREHNHHIRSHDYTRERVLNSSYHVIQGPTQNKPFKCSLKVHIPPHPLKLA